MGWNWQFATFCFLLMITVCCATEEVQCPNEKPVFCHSIGGCTLLQHNATYCTDLSNYTTRQQLPDEDVFCPEGYIFCSDRKRCEKVGTRCELYCNSTLKNCTEYGQCISPNSSCQSLRNDSCKDDICTNANHQCPNEKPVFCHSIGGCTLLQHNATYCTDLSNYTTRQQLPDEDVFCPEGYIFCSDRKRCEKVGTRCELYCNSTLKNCTEYGQCISPNSSCQSLRNDYCKDDICTNANLQLKVCKESHMICKKFEMYEWKYLDIGKLISNINKKLKVCPPKKTFCPLNNKCLDPHENCNSTTEIDETTAPFEDMCHNNEHFCRLFGRCIPKERSCRTEDIIAIHNGIQGNSTFDYTRCHSGHFCPVLGKCIDGWYDCPNDINPDVVLNKLKQIPMPTCGNTSEIYCPSEGKCLKPWLCEPEMSHSFMNMEMKNFFGKKSSGWIPYCEVRKQMCQSAVATTMKCSGKGKLEDCPSLKNNDSRCLDKETCQKTAKKVEICKKRSTLCSSKNMYDEGMKWDVINSVCKHNDTQFCWATGECRNVKSDGPCPPIDAVSVISNHYNGFTPWGELCKYPDWQYCPQFSACAPPQVQCRVQSLIDKLKGGEKLEDIFDMKCSRNTNGKTKFCPNSMLCIDQYERCDDKVGNAYFKANKFCNSSTAFYCPSTGKCQSELRCDDNDNIRALRTPCIHRHFCEDTLQCVDNPSQCSTKDFFDGITNNVDEMCRVMEYQCPRLMIANLECQDSCEIESSKPALDVNHDPDISKCSTHDCMSKCQSDGCMNAGTHQNEFCSIILGSHYDGCDKHQNVTDQSEANLLQLLANNREQFKCFDSTKPYFCPYSEECVSNFTIECSPTVHSRLESESYSDFQCKNGSFYCSAVSGCIPVGKQCNFQYLLDLVKNSSSSEFCKIGYKFCPLMLGCISNRSICNMDTLLIGDHSMCGRGIFCKTTAGCVNRPEDCPVKNQTSSKGRAMGFICPINTRWCHNISQCVSNTSSCPSMPVEVPGMLGFCKNAELYCARREVAREKCSSCSACPKGFKKCSRNCVRAEVYEQKCSAEKICSVDEKICETSPKLCIPKDIPCCGENMKLCGRQCVSKYEFCPPRDSCLGTKCDDMKTKPICTTLWNKCPLAYNVSLEAGKRLLEDAFADLCPQWNQMFCPWNGKCVSKGTECSPHSEIEIFPRKFSKSCSDDKYHECPITGKCVLSKSCSYAPLLDYINSATSSFKELSGRSPANHYSCGQNMYYCPFRDSCEPLDSFSLCEGNSMHVDCHGMYSCQRALSCTKDHEECLQAIPAGLIAGMCEQSQRYCWKTMECVEHDRFYQVCESSVPMAKIAYKERGYLALCDMRQSYCKAQSIPYGNCQRCAENCYEGYYWCDLIHMCLKEGKPCTHRGPCGEGEYMCKNKCVNRYEPCYHECQGVDCGSPAPNESGGSGRFCFSEDGECSAVQSKLREMCALSMDICPEASKIASNTGKIQSLKSFLQDIALKTCAPGQAWCPFSTECYNPLDKPNYCNNQLSFGGERVYNYPWGERCGNTTDSHYNTIKFYYCPFTGTCLHPHISCSIKTLVDFIKKKQKPTGIFCPNGQKLCLVNMRCMHKGEKCRPDETKNLCPTHMHFCQKDFQCYNSSSECISLHSTLAGVVDLQQVTDSTCPETHEYCEDVMSCHPKGQCPGTDTLTLPDTDDPEGYWSWCSTRKLFCNRVKSTLSKCNARCKGDQQCESNKYYCPLLHMCISNDEPCGTCPVRETSSVCQQVQLNQKATCLTAELQCPSMNQYIDTTNGSNLFAADFRNLLMHQCPPGEHYCPFAMQCIRKDMKCTYDSMNNEETDLLPWGGKCFGRMKYCSWFGTCVPESVICNLQTLVDWFQMADPTKYPPGFGRKACFENQKFCPVTMRCMKSADYESSCSMDCSSGQCKSNRFGQLLERWNECKKNGYEICPKSMMCTNATENCESMVISPPNMQTVRMDGEVATGFACQPDEQFCTTTWSCEKKTIQCLPPTNLVVPNDESGFFSFCKMRNLVCRSTFEVVGNCMETCSVLCESDEFYCQTSQKCQERHTYCDSPSLEPCDRGSTYCDAVGKCLPNTQACEASEIGTVDKKCYFLIMRTGGVSFHDIPYDGLWKIPRNKLMAIIKLGGQDFGTWSINGLEITSKVTEENAWIVDPYSSIDYRPTKPVKGLAMVLFAFLDKSLFTAMNSFINLRQLATDKNIQSITYYNLGIAIPPSGEPKFKRIISSKHTIKEDSKCEENQYKITDKFDFNDAYDLGVDLDTLGCTYHSSFDSEISENVKQLFKNRGLIIIDSSFLKSMRGRWMVKKEMYGRTDWFPMNKIYRMKNREFVTVGTDDSICYTPARDESGTFKLDITPGFIADTEMYSRPLFTFGDQSVDFELIIEDENDPPVLPSRLELPAMPYTLDLQTYQGFTVQELLTTNVYRGFSAIRVLDNGNQLGICVENIHDVYALSTIGVWQYKLEQQGNWQDIPSMFGMDDNRMKVLSRYPSMPASVLCLKPNDRLKFHLANNTVFGKATSKSLLQIRLRAWGINDKSMIMHGVFNMTQEMNVFISSKYGTALLKRRGCFGIAGSGLTVDRCGKCGGNGQQCVGCDGVLNSGARYDRCGLCTGGQTGKAAEFARDCYGRCNGTYIELECNGKQMCIPNGPALTKFNDCNGICNGGAKLVCGQCVGGNTGLNPSDYLPDQCGICSGDSSTCTDCSGAPFGLRKLDACGNCKDPTDQSFNKGCNFKLGNFKPQKCSAAGGCRVSILMSVPDVCLFCPKKKYTVESCSFGSVQALSVRMSANMKRMYMTAPPTNDNQVEISCTITDENGISTTTTTAKNFSYINFALSNITDFQPKQFNSGSDTTVTIMGTSFIDQRISCLGPQFRNGRYKFIPAIYVNSTKITCQYKNVKFTQNSNLKIAYHVDHKNFAIIEASDKLVISAQMPTPVSAKLRNSLNALVVKFNGAIVLARKDFDCSDLLLDTTSLGMKPRCRVGGNNLVLRFGRNATIKPADTLNINMTSMLPRLASADVTSYVTTVDSVTVDNVANPPNFEILIKGKDVFGDCETIKFRVKASKGSGGRPLTMAYLLLTETNITTLTSEQLAKYNTLKTTLMQEKSTKISFAASMIDVGIQYKLTVNTLNFLGTQAATTKLFQKVVDTVPAVRLPSRKLIKGYKRNYLKVAARVSKCLDKNAASSLALSYEWNIEGAPYKGVREKVYTIAPDEIQPGTYKVTCTVCMESDSSLCATASMELIVQGIFIASMQGGRRQTINIRDDLVLDASPSRISEAWKNDTVYEWEILDENDASIIYRDTNNDLVSFGLQRGEKLMLGQVADLMVSGKYEIKLTIRRGSGATTEELSEITQKLLVVQDRPAYVFLRPSGESIDATKPYSLCGYVKNRDVTVFVAYTWSFETEDDEYDSIELLPEMVHGEISGTFLRFKQLCFNLKSNILKGGTTYKLKLTVDNNVIETSQERIINTVSPPTAGIFTVSPTSGTALETKFSFEAHDWFGSSDLTYRFFYVFTNERGQRRFKMLPGDGGNSIEDVLPYLNDGNVTVYCNATDVNGGLATASVNVTVQTKQFSVNDVTDLSANADEYLLASDVDKVETLVTSLKLSMGTDLEKDGDAVAEKVKEVLTDVRQKILADVKLGGYQNPESQKSTVKVLADTTDGMSDSSEMNDVVTVLQNMIGAAQQTSGGRRRRRSTEDSLNVVYRTVDEVETFLETFDNIIQPSSYDLPSLESKASYLLSVNALGASLCKSTQFGAPPSTAVSNLVTIQATQHDFSTEDSLSTTIVAKTNASTDITFSQSTKDEYELWSCYEDFTCSGVCLTAAQFSEDVISVSNAGNRYSDILHLQINNPMLATLLSPSNHTYTFELTLITDMNDTIEYPVCKIWSGIEWTTNDTDISYTNVTKGSKVECTISTLNTYMVVFSEEKIIPTQPPSTTTTTTVQPVTATTTKLRVSFDGECTDFFNDTTKATFEEHMRKELANKLLVHYTTISKITASCGSVIIDFELDLSNAIDPDTFASEKKQALTDLYEAGNLVIYAPNGKQLKASACCSDTSGPSVGRRKTVEDDDSVGITIGIVFGVLVAVGGALALAMYIRKKRSRSLQITEQKQQQQSCNNSVTSPPQRQELFELNEQPTKPNTAPVPTITPTSASTPAPPTTVPVSFPEVNQQFESPRYPTKLPPITPKVNDV